MPDFFFRTEDIRPEDVPLYFVETKQDREIVEALKARNPVVLIGSRGMGKSFLFRVAEAELLSSFDEKSILPVYVTFNKSSLINTTNQSQFQAWMLARLCSRIVRVLRMQGLLAVVPSSVSVLTGGYSGTTNSETRVEQIATAFESSWQNPATQIDLSGLPTVDEFRDSMEDLCITLNLERIQVFFDEAAHVFMPEQATTILHSFQGLKGALPYRQRCCLSRCNIIW